VPKQSARVNLLVLEGLADSYLPAVTSITEIRTEELYWVGSSHRQLIGVKGRSYLQSSHTPGLNFISAYSSSRPRLCENYLTASAFGTVLKK